MALTLTSVVFFFYLCRECTVCPIVKPNYTCGTDNNTYSSPCKLDYTNCMQGSDVKVACKGFCPCPTSTDLKKGKQAMRLSQFESKYKTTVNNVTPLKPKVIFAPDVAKFKLELFGKKSLKDAQAATLDWSIDKQRQRGYNDVHPEKKELPLLNGRHLEKLILSLFFFIIKFILQNVVILRSIRWGIAS